MAELCSRLISHVTALACCRLKCTSSNKVSQAHAHWEQTYRTWFEPEAFFTRTALRCKKMRRKDTGNIKTDCSFKGGNCKGYEREKKKVRFFSIIHFEGIHCN